MRLDSSHPQIREGARIVVTGGAGFIGSALADFLSTTYDIVAVDNLSTGDWSRCKGTYEKINLDIVSAAPTELASLLKGADALCHLAAVKLHNSLNSSDQIIATNVLASQRLFEEAGNSGVKRVLFTSSLYAYGSMGPREMSESDPVSPHTLYGASKLMGENMVKIAAERFGYSYVIPRLFFIYGPNQFADGGYKSVIVKNFERLKQGLPAEINGDGSQILDYVFLDDCVQILSKLLTSDFQGVVNVSSGDGISILDLVQEMLSVSGGSETEYLPRDWTHGSRRVGTMNLLKSIIESNLGTPIKEGLLKTWQSMATRAS